MHLTTVIDLTSLNSKGSMKVRRIKVACSLEPLDLTDRTSNTAGASMIKARQINISLILFLPLILSASFKATGPRGGLQTHFKDSLLYICIIVLFLFGCILCWFTDTNVERYTSTHIYIFVCDCVPFKLQVVIH